MNENQGNIRFMVEFILPEVFTIEMTDSIPEQRKKVDSYFYNSKLLSYTLAEDRSKLWAIFVCNSEAELINLIEKLPMTKYLDYNYHIVMFHEMVSHFPSFSLN
jgi:hypothetical protein